MQRPRQPRRSPPSRGEQFLFSLALVILGLLWLTRELSVWATVLCVAGIAGGAVGMVHFGRTWVRSRGEQPTRR